MTFPKERNIEVLIKKSIKILFWFYLLFYLNLGKMRVFQKNAFRPQINVHPVRLAFRRRGKFISGFL